MAFIECSECGKKISDKALHCPQCGSPKVTVASPIPRVTYLYERPRKRIKIRIFLLLLLVIIIGVSCWYWRASKSDSFVQPLAGIFASFRQPKKVVNERVELKQGQFIAYRFGINRDARVEVQVNAIPQDVEVMTMKKEEADKLCQTSGRLSGEEYTYVQALSAKQVHMMDKAEVLPKGEWAVFVSRPSEDLLFQERTSVNIAVTVY